jgi:hypothetical protein
VLDLLSLKNILIPHFLKYPLRGTKHLDFISFKQAFHIIENKEHLTEKGLNKLYLLKMGMNSHREFSQLNYYAPNHTKESSIDYIPIDGHYINGFIAEDGCLALHTGKHFGTMYLFISQHINNKLLLTSIANYFKSPSKVYALTSKYLQINLGGAQL